MRFAFEIDYDGTNYHGWQRQDNANSVQAEIEKALSMLNNSDVSVHGCGRTDTGVHARNFILHFDLSAPIENLVYRMNRVLPSDISVGALYEVPEEFHSRFDATSRSYSYRLATKKDPFIRKTSYLYLRPFDIEKMNSLCEVLKQYELFGSFCKSNSQNKTDRCDIKAAEWIENENGYRFEITADRFLRNMVRAIVGTLLDINEGVIDAERFSSIIEANDRTLAGRSAPAHGLTLENVEYDRSGWRKIE